MAAVLIGPTKNKNNKQQTGNPFSSTPAAGCQIDF
jgi:hypothetical protein